MLQHKAGNFTYFIQSAKVREQRLVPRACHHRQGHPPVTGIIYRGGCLHQKIYDKPFLLQLTLSFPIKR